MESYGKVIGFVTMPGILIHELAHYFACVLTRIKVYDFRYNDFEGTDKTPLGYVIHEQTESYIKLFLITLAPLLFNSIVALFITLPISYTFLKEEFKIWHFSVLYFSFAVAIHGIPSTTETNVLIIKSISALKKFNPLALLGLIISTFIKLFLFLRAYIPYFIPDLMYGGGIVILGLSVGNLIIENWSKIGYLSYIIYGVVFYLLIVSFYKRKVLIKFFSSIYREACLYMVLSIGVSIFIPLWIWLILISREMLIKECMRLGISSFPVIFVVILAFILLFLLLGILYLIYLFLRFVFGLGRNKRGTTS